MTVTSGKKAAQTTVNANSRELCRRQAMQSVKAAQKKGNVSADGYADDKSTLAEGYADDR